MTGTTKIKRLKQEYIKYFEDVPVQKYAAMSIARDEDTIIRWRKEDGDFADAVQRAKANWIRKRVIASKAEFALERLEREVFNPHLTVAYESSAGLSSTREKLRDFLDEIGKVNPEDALRSFMDDTSDGAYDLPVSANAS